MDSKQVKMVISGFQKIFKKKNPKSNRVKIPFGLDLAIASKAIMRATGMFAACEPQREMLETRVFVCETVGIVFMLRKSEHIINKKSSKLPLLRSQVLLFDKDSKPISYTDIGIIKAWAITLNIQFSKTDPSGYGRRNKHTRQDNLPDTCAVTIIEKWIANTRDVYKCKISHGLYEIPGQGTLSVETLQEVMQRTVTSKGYPVSATRTTSHSLRYGGATMMAAAGFPQYIIAMYGGWTKESTALRIYTKLPEEILGQVSLHMARMGTGSASQMFIEDAIVVAQGFNNHKEQGRKRKRE